MRNSNFGIGILHVKRQILTYFFGLFCLLAQVFIVSFNRACKDISTKNIEKFLWLSFCDMTTFKKEMYRSCNLDPMRVLYEFQIDISTNREIKYRNIEILVEFYRPFIRRTRQK